MSRFSFVLTMFAAACVATSTFAGAAPPPDSVQITPTTPGNTPTAPVAPANAPNAQTAPAAAPPEQIIPAAGITADELAAWLRAENFTVAAETLAPDIPHMLKTYLVTSVDGVKFVIFFFDCTGDRCSSLQFRAFWTPSKLTIDQINQWNEKTRWIKAILETDQNDCSAEMDVILDGSSYRTIANWVATWDSGLVAFATVNSTGMLVARNEKTVLPGLVVGRTTYGDVVSAAGRPSSDRRTATGERIVRYSFERLRSHLNGAGGAATHLVGRDAEGSTATLTFDPAGVLLAYGSGAADMRSGAGVKSQNENSIVRVNYAN
jgi:hypothetical protein